MVQRRMRRVQAIVLPLLRAELPEVLVTSELPDADLRTYPLLNVRRLGGASRLVDGLELATIEIMAISARGRAESEDLYLDARQVIWNAVDQQTVTSAGYFHSFRETVGPTPVSSPFDDTWSTQGLIQLGVRPPR